MEIGEIIGNTENIYIVLKKLMKFLEIFTAEREINETNLVQNEQRS